MSVILIVLNIQLIQHDDANIFLDSLFDLIGATGLVTIGMILNE